MTQPTNNAVDLLAILSDEQIDRFEGRWGDRPHDQDVIHKMLAHQVRQTLETVYMAALQGGPANFVDALETALGVNLIPVMDGDGFKHTTEWEGNVVGEPCRLLLEQCRSYNAGSMALIMYNGADEPQAGVLVYDDPAMLTELLKAVQVIEADTPPGEGCSHSQGEDVSGVL